MTTISFEKYNYFFEKTGGFLARKNLEAYSWSVFILSFWKIYYEFELLNIYARLKPGIFKTVTGIFSAEII